MNILERMRSEVLGVYVGEQHLLLVLVREGKCIWKSHCVIDGDYDLPVTIETALRDGTRSGRISKRCVVALGPTRVIVKRIAGIESTGALVRTKEVRDTPRRFFILPWDDIRVSDVVELPNGDLWCAAFDWGAVEPCLMALRSLGWRNVNVLPARVPIEAQPKAENGGDVAAELETMSAEFAEQELVELTTRDDKQTLFAATLDAQATGSFGLSATLAIGTALFVSAVGGLLLVDTIAAHRDQSFIQLKSDSTGIVKHEIRQQSEIDSNLRRLSSFASHHHSTIARLADIAAVMDTVGYVDEIALTDTTVQLSGRAASAAAIPSLFRAIPWVRDASILGNLTRSENDSSAQNVSIALTSQSHILRR